MNRLLALFFGMIMVWSLPLRLLADEAQSQDDLSKLDKQALRRAGYRYLNLGDDLHARQCGEQLLKLAAQENDRYFAELYGYLFIGMSLIDSNKANENFSYLNKAYLLAEQSQNHDALAAVFNALGNYALFVNDDSYTALSWYFQALEQAKLLGDNKRYATYLSNIAGAYSIREDLSGLSFAEEAIDMARENGEEVPLYYALLNATNYYLMTTDTLKAELSFREAEQLYRKLKFNMDVDILFFQARLHELKGDFRKAFGCYSKAMECFDGAASSSITMTYIYCARLLRKMQRLDEAVEMLEQGLAHIEQNGAVAIHKARIFKELLLCYRESGAYSKALEYAMRYQDYQWKSVNDTHERALQETRIKHDIYSREQRISQQQVEILENRYKITVLLLVLIILVVALGLAFFYYKKKDQLLRTIVKQNLSYQQREQLLLQQLEQARATTADGEQLQQQPAGNGQLLSEERVQELMGRFTTLMMEQHLYTDASITVAGVAERLGTNRTYLSKAINDSTGKSFPQVVSEYRIRRAIAEISDLQTNKPLKQIAYEVGFNSLSTFYATFQSVTGMTPARYRAKLQEIDGER